MKLKTTTSLRLTLIFVLMGLLSTGCMKPPALNTDFGPEVSANQLNSTLGGAQYEATSSTVQNIKKGEFASFEKTTQIENFYPTVVRQRADTVTDRKEDANKIIYTITRQLRELDSSTGNMKHSLTQDSACLEKTSGGCNSAVSSTVNFLDVMQAAKVLKSLVQDPPLDLVTRSGHMSDLSWKAIAQQASSASSSGIKWTYHNLKKIYGTQETPAAVATKPNCGGRKNPCDSPMATIQVSFDEVDWSSEQYPVKYSYNLIFSGDSPYFAAQLASCGSTTIPYKDQRIAILQCESIKEFDVGHD